VEECRRPAGSKPPIVLSVYWGRTILRKRFAFRGRRGKVNVPRCMVVKRETGLLLCYNKLKKKREPGQPLRSFRKSKEEAQGMEGPD